MESYLTAADTGSGEITEKKSRFIAAVAHVETEDEAAAFVERIRKENWNARHNCFAYRLREGNTERAADDGEPSGTAGRPILQAIKGAELNDTIVVVTRYFGGVLLGTGGLTRAYAAAAAEGIRNTEKVRMIKAVRGRITADHRDAGKIRNFLKENGAGILDIIYGEKVTLHVLFPGDKKEKLQKAVTELTNARAETCLEEEGFFPES